MKMIIWCVSLLVFNIKSFYRLCLYSPLKSHPTILSSYVILSKK